MAKNDAAGLVAFRRAGLPRAMAHGAPPSSLSAEGERDGC
jgi:hypothetical protein